MSKFRFTGEMLLAPLAKLPHGILQLLGSKGPAGAAGRALIASEMNALLDAHLATLVSKFRFTVEMFEDCWHRSKAVTQQEVVHKANAALDAHLSTLEQVYGNYQPTKGRGHRGVWQHKEDGAGDTHTALLFDVSPRSGEGEE